MCKGQISKFMFTVCVCACIILFDGDLKSSVCVYGGIFETVIQCTDGGDTG